MALPASPDRSALLAGSDLPRAEVALARLFRDTWALRIRVAIGAVPASEGVGQGGLFLCRFLSGDVRGAQESEQACKNGKIELTAHPYYLFFDTTRLTLVPRLL